MHINEMALRLGLNPETCREVLAKLAADRELYTATTNRVRTHVATGRPCLDDGQASPPPVPNPA